MDSAMSLLEAPNAKKQTGAFLFCFKFVDSFSIVGATISCQIANPVGAAPIRYGASNRDNMV